MSSPARDPRTLASRFSTSSLLVHDNCDGIPQRRSKAGSMKAHKSVPLLQYRSLHVPAITTESPPSSPDSPAWSPSTQSPPDSPLPRTPRTGSGIIYFSTTKNPAPVPPPNSHAPLHSPHLDTSTISLTSLESRAATPVSRYSKYSTPVTNSLEENPNDPICDIVSPLETQHLATALSIVETGFSEIEDTVLHRTDVSFNNDDPYKISAGWDKFPSYGVGRAAGDERSLRQFSRPPPLRNSAPRTPHNIRSRMKTAFKKVSASIKTKNRVPPSLSVISAPVPLDLPGYNGSVALSLSSPIQVARFLYASEKTHEERHKLNHFPRPLGTSNSPPIEYVRQIPGVEDACLPSNRRLASNWSNTSLTSSLKDRPSPGLALTPEDPGSCAYISTKGSEFDEVQGIANVSSESFGLPPNRDDGSIVLRLSTHSIPKPPFPDHHVIPMSSKLNSPLHPDIVQALKTLRSSLPLSMPLSLNDPSFVPACMPSTPPPFDPELMPFAARQSKEKTYEQLVASVRATSVEQRTSTICGRILVQETQAGEELFRKVSKRATPKIGLGLGVPVETVHSGLTMGDPFEGCST